MEHDHNDGNGDPPPLDGPFSIIITNNPQHNLDLLANVWVCASRLTSDPLPSSLNTRIYKPKCHVKFNNPLPYKNISKSSSPLSQHLNITPTTTRPSTSGIDGNNNNIQPVDLSLKQAPLPSKRRRIRSTSDLARIQRQVAVTLPTIPPVGQSGYEKFKQSVPRHLHSEEPPFLPPGTTIIALCAQSC